MTSDDSADVSRLITTADGYVDLKMAGHAARELAAVPEEFRNGFHYYWVDCRLQMLQENWARAREIAAEICKHQPDEAASWVTLAYATRRAVGLDEAKALLLEAIPRFPRDAIFPYNLACYECCTGNLERARELLKTAFTLGPEYAGLVRDDEDLEPLWPEMPYGI